jgi:hypothetical protein
VRLPLCHNLLLDCFYQRVFHRAPKTYPNLCHSEVANAAVLHDGDCAAPSTGNAAHH